jgi:hypothetical protein
MLSKAEHLLISRELGRLRVELMLCGDDQVRKSIQQDILLLRRALTITARK